MLNIIKNKSYSLILTAYCGKNHNSNKQKLEEFTLKPEKMTIVSLMMSMHTRQRARGTHSFSFFVNKKCNKKEKQTRKHNILNTISIVTKIIQFFQFEVTNQVG